MLVRPLFLKEGNKSKCEYKFWAWPWLLLACCNSIYLHFADTQHQFNARESDWGFTSFMPLGELYDPSRGYLVNDTLVVEAEVLVRRIVDYWTYDSKKETGYVGLKNQGATCYMNSLLQTLYHIPYFRKVALLVIFFLYAVFHLFGCRLILNFDLGYCILGCLPYANNRE